MNVSKFSFELLLRFVKKLDENKLDMINQSKIKLNLRNIYLIFTGKNFID